MSSTFTHLTTDNLMPAVQIPYPLEEDDRIRRFYGGRKDDARITANEEYTKFRLPKYSLKNFQMFAYAHKDMIEYSDEEWKEIQYKGTSSKENPTTFTYL